MLLTVVMARRLSDSALSLVQVQEDAHYQQDVMDIKR
jgi:hypothetical protein